MYVRHVSFEAQQSTDSFSLQIVWCCVGSRLCVRTLQLGHTHQLQCLLEKQKLKTVS